MWAALIAAAVLTAQSDDLSTRIAQSAAAAEALQGPLDGSWVLRDRDGRVLYTIQVTDPPSGGPLRAAWKADGNPAPVDRITHFGAALYILLDGVNVRLRHHVSGDWTGVMVKRGRRIAVTMKRGP